MAECQFCRKILLRGDVHGPIEFTTDPLIVRFAPLKPVALGHMLFVPRPHIVDAADDPFVTGMAFVQAARWGRERDEAFNLITSRGSEATASITHLHVHYVPRRAGDGLKLPWSR